MGVWNAYIQNLGGGTDGGVFNGRMEYQSVRAENLPFVENYQYVSANFDDYDAHKHQHETGSGSNSERTGSYTRLSFVGEYGITTKEVFSPGWNFTGCAYNASCRYTPEEYSLSLRRYKTGEYDWNYPSIIDDFGPNRTSFQDQHRKSKYVFYNRGLWGNIKKAKKYI